MKLQHPDDLPAEFFEPEPEEGIEMKTRKAQGVVGRMVRVNGQHARVRKIVGEFIGLDHPVDGKWVVNRSEVEFVRRDYTAQK